MEASSARTGNIVLSALRLDARNKKQASKLHELSHIVSGHTAIYTKLQ
jgi:hypothetical protein